MLLSNINCRKISRFHANKKGKKKNPQKPDIGMVPIGCTQHVYVIIYLSVTYIEMTIDYCSSTKTGTFGY